MCRVPAQPDTAPTGGDGPPGSTAPIDAREPDRAVRTLARWVLAGLLLVAGIAHLVSPNPFAAQVPRWFPAPDATILVSGLVEIALAIALVTTRSRSWVVGWIVAGFFVVIFPGNVSQFVTGTDAFGLESDAARFVRLLFQPALVVWALWCTGAWREWRTRRS